MKIFKWLSISAVSLLVGVVMFAYSGVYNVSALEPHSALSNWLMSATMHASVARRAKEVKVPELTEQLKLAGINDFETMCSGCHGSPGKRPEAMGLGLNPPAGDLGHSAKHLSAEELFWITKNGIKMTGMPAWGKTHDDESIWPVVAFLTSLPTHDAQSYIAQLERARKDGVGHHAPGPHEPETEKDTQIEKSGDDHSGHRH